MADQTANSSEDATRPHMLTRAEAAFVLLAAFFLVCAAAGWGLCAVHGVYLEAYYPEPLAHSLTHHTFQSAVNWMDQELARPGSNDEPWPFWTPANPRGSVTDWHCDAWGAHFRCRKLDRSGPNGRLFVVDGAGPDGRFDTGDDIRLSTAELVRIGRPPARAP